VRLLAIEKARLTVLPLQSWSVSKREASYIRQAALTIQIAALRRPRDDLPQRLILGCIPIDLETELVSSLVPLESRQLSGWARYLWGIDKVSPGERQPYQSCEVYFWLHRSCRPLRGLRIDLVGGGGRGWIAGMRGSACCWVRLRGHGAVVSLHRRRMECELLFLNHVLGVCPSHEREACVWSTNDGCRVRWSLGLGWYGLASFSPRLQNKAPVISDPSPTPVHVWYSGPWEYLTSSFNL
jgi:hypothetical protein